MIGAASPLIIGGIFKFNGLHLSTLPSNAAESSRLDVLVSETTPKPAYYCHPVATISLVVSDAERDVLLDAHDELVGRVKDVTEVEKRLRHKLLPRNAWRLIPFFELFTCSPKDELHQW